MNKVYILWWLLGLLCRANSHHHKPFSRFDSVTLITDLSGSLSGSGFLGISSSAVDNLAQTDRSSNYRPQADALLFSPLQALCKCHAVVLPQTLNARLCSDALKVKRAEQPAGHFRKPLHCGRKYLGAAWGKPLSEQLPSRRSSPRLKVIVHFWDFLCVTWNSCRSECFHIVRRLWKESSLRSITSSTRSQHVLRRLPEPGSRQHSHWIIEFQAEQQSQREDKYKSLINTVNVYASMSMCNIRVGREESTVVCTNVFEYFGLSRSESFDLDSLIQFSLETDV